MQCVLLGDTEKALLLCLEIFLPEKEIIQH